jgi:hypothetical protein
MVYPFDRPADLEIRDGTGTEAFELDGTAFLVSTRLQAKPVAGWSMELRDKRRGKTLHRWTMPTGVYKATPTA